MTKIRSLERELGAIAAAAAAAAEDSLSSSSSCCSGSASENSHAGSSSPAASRTAQPPLSNTGSRFDVLMRVATKHNKNRTKNASKPSTMSYADAASAPAAAPQQRGADNNNNNNNNNKQQARATTPVGRPSGIPTPLPYKKLRPQPFSHLLVCDFEATCESGSIHYPHEIIEFPVVVVDCATLRIVAEFHEYVKPTKNPVLTKFCTELTGITQEMTDAADTLPVVISRFSAWLHDTVYPLCRTWLTTHGSDALSTNLKSEQKRFVFDERTSQAAACVAEEAMLCFVTDGPWDMRRFMHECAVLRDGIEFPPLFYRYINVRHCYSEHFRSRQIKLTHMLKRLNMGFEGQRHSGIDDTRNITRVLAELLARGYRVHHVSSIKYAHRGDAFLANNALAQEILEEYGDVEEKRPRRQQQQQQEQHRKGVPRNQTRRGGGRGRK